MKIRDIHLLAFYVTKPRNPKMTHIKGYMLDPANHQYDERIEFTKGLNGKDQSYAKVILNLNQKKVVKNSWGTDRTFDDYFKYFLQAYPEYIINVMGQLDMQYLEQFIPKEDAKSDVTDVEAKDVASESAVTE
jgi:inhibitor of KinA sporulation pathway (predicted exonuclease)